MNILGLGVVAASVTGLAATEAQALHCEKRAWQFCSLALLLGSSGYLLIRQTNPTLKLDSSSRNKELFASICLVRQLVKFPTEESKITTDALLQVVKDAWQYNCQFKKLHNKDGAPNVWFVHCHDAMELLGFECADDFISAYKQIDGTPEFHDESSNEYKSLNTFITTSLNAEHARDWKW